MRVVPIRYTADVDAARRFYLALGLSSGPESRPGAWVELPAASGMLALHTASDVAPGTCELALEVKLAPGVSTMGTMARAKPTIGCTIRSRSGTTS